MINKSIVIKQLNELPDEFTLDQLIDKLIFIDKVKEGIIQSEQNDVIPHNKLEEEVKEWFK